MEKRPTTTEPSVGLQGGAPLMAGAIDTETLEILEAWSRKDATDDPEKLKAAQKELDEFKKAMDGSGRTRFCKV